MIHIETFMIIIVLEEILCLMSITFVFEEQGEVRSGLNFN